MVNYKELEMAKNKGVYGETFGEAEKYAVSAVKKIKLPWSEIICASVSISLLILFSVLEIALFIIGSYEMANEMFANLPSVIGLILSSKVCVSIIVFALFTVSCFQIVPIVLATCVMSDDIHLNKKIYSFEIYKQAVKLSPSSIFKISSVLFILCFSLVYIIIAPLFVFDGFLLGIIRQLRNAIGAIYALLLLLIGAIPGRMLIYIIPIKVFEPNVKGFVNLMKRNSYLKSKNAYADSAFTASGLFWIFYIGVALGLVPCALIILSMGAIKDVFWQCISFGVGLTTLLPCGWVVLNMFQNNVASLALGYKQCIENEQLETDSCPVLHDQTV